MCKDKEEIQSESRNCGMRRYGGYTPGTKGYTPEQMNDRGYTPEASEHDELPLAPVDSSSGETPGITEKE